mmetsp:Transcript_20892/g.61823  ORF Transcript_20892/g.61823 Transcript_20892/m.61823 type:complete len:247 (+) Transcript_20892:2-742(+)
MARVRAVCCALLAAKQTAAFAILTTRATHRAPLAPPRCASRADGSSWLDRIGSFFAGGEVEEATPELLDLIEFLTRERGFRARLTLGSEPARSAGGSGVLAKRTSGTAGIELLVAFNADDTPGYDPLQGDVLLLKESRYLAAPPAFWIAEYETPDDAFPSLWQMRLRSTGISVGGEELVEEGAIVFLSAKAERTRTGGWNLANGKITVKETVRFSNNILAELKVIGVFELVPREADAADVTDVHGV